jgi:ribosomal protein L37AE/L43A
MKCPQCWGGMKFRRQFSTAGIFECQACGFSLDAKENPPACPECGQTLDISRARPSGLWRDIWGFCPGCDSLFSMS